MSDKELAQREACPRCNIVGRCLGCGKVREPETPPAGSDEACRESAGAEWIAVTERQPSEHPFKALVCMKEWPGVAVGFFWSKGNALGWRDINDKPIPATHWMPLPAPPKGDL